MKASAHLPLIADATLAPVERTIFERLGGTPWSAADLTPAAVAAANRKWVTLRQAAGFSGSTGGWVTTGATNPKMGLNSIGVTVHSATDAADIWKQVPVARKRAMGRSLGVSIAEINRVLAQTVCPFSTKGCRGGCTTAKSSNAAVGTTPVSRLTRTLFALFEPAAAFTKTGDALVKLRKKHGADARWRVNVSDDIRWELLAPGLFDLGVKGYAYTKWAPAQRPRTSFFAVVYSATERTTDQQIADMVGAGHSVAVVIDVPRKKIPPTFRGLPTSNGDLTDDLHAHTPATVVGLSAKGPTKAIKDQMRAAGFSKPATP